MKDAIWYRIFGPTMAMLVPGGMVLKTTEEAWPTETDCALSVSQVFIPGDRAQLLYWINSAREQNGMDKIMVAA